MTQTGLGYRLHIFVPRFQELEGLIKLQRVRDVIMLITMSGHELDGVISLAPERLGYPDLRPEQRSAIHSYGRERLFHLPPRRQYGSHHITLVVFQGLESMSDKHTFRKFGRLFHRIA